jgi:sulfite reductase (NADPH) flavoprotein alpha-component
MVLRNPPVEAWLTVEQGPQAGASFPWHGSEAIIGSGEASHILLHDPMASRRHARLDWRDGQSVIEDLGSCSGTFVNNVQIAGPRTLCPGDRILIGRTLLRYAVGHPPETVSAVHERATGEPSAERGAVPARLVLAAAEQANRLLGHENLGFLSELHGVMPARPPALHLPRGYEVWDEIAADLPRLFRTLRVRPALEELPELSANENDLPDAYLLRASCIISMLAHSYCRIEANPPDTLLPAAIRQPWEEIARRLQRPAPHLSYIDLIMYNWRLVDPERTDPMRVNNLCLLVPTVDNREERIFYLTQVEILAQSAPIIPALVRAQEAAQRSDADALEQELAGIADRLHHVAFHSLLSIDPNPYSNSHVDPVVWAKTVAPFAVPIRSGVAGPSGTAAPIFHLLDVFFGRHRYDSRFGAEMLHLRHWYPRHWQEFLTALGEVSVAKFVESSQDTRLQGLYKEAVQAYVGNNGFLSRHRLKVYGYLDIGFKVGRSVTITGFSGMFKDRTWDQVDSELAEARQERAAGFPPSGHTAFLKRVETISSAANPLRWVKRVVLDVSQAGLRYRPGDRCAVLPENREDLINRTLLALQARGDEMIPLTTEWRAAINLREGYRGSTALPLRVLLRFGRIRPVDRATAKVVYEASLSTTLRRIIEARAEDQWELWDLLQMLAEAGFDVRRLWKAHPGEREHICRVVPPETFRMYSISSSLASRPPAADEDPRKRVPVDSELHLTVGRLWYETQESRVTASGQRLGTASSYLGEGAGRTDEGTLRIPMQLVRPPRFSLPADPSVPVVMFAGGTGIAPFPGFIQERAAQPGAGPAWLFFSTHGPTEFHYQEELERCVAQGHLNLRVVFSREPLEARFVQDGERGHFVFEPGEQRHIGDEIRRDENARLLCNLIRSRQDGGQEGHLYVCGRTGFAKSVLAAVSDILEKDRSSFPSASFEEARTELPGEGDSQGRAGQLLYRLVGEARYHQDIFTTYTRPQAEVRPVYDTSQLVVHNDDEAGYWMALNGRVYDLTQFAHMHPGGFKVIRSYAGMDATRAYRKVLHHANPEVDSMLGMFEIGAMRRLDFGTEWGSAIGPKGLHSILLADVFRSWARFLYTIVEMQNALANDYTLREHALTRDEYPTSISPLKLQFLLEVHDRFTLNYVEGSLGQPLEDLWAVTSGICTPKQDVRWMRDTIRRILSSPEAETVKQLSRELAVRIREFADAGSDVQQPAPRIILDGTSLLERENKRFLKEMKAALCRGVQIFEAYQQDTVRHGAAQLLDTIKGIPALLEAYQARLLAGALRLFMARDPHQRP